MGVKPLGREAQGSTPKMRKPPLKARPYIAEDVVSARRSSANHSQRSDDPTGGTSLDQKPDAGDSLSSSATPYDPAMSTYCSTPDAQKNASFSVHDASALGDTSMRSGFSREHSIKTSSMSELYPVSEHLDLQERPSGTRGTPLAINSTGEQQAIVTHRIHSNYTSAGTTFAMRIVNPRTGADTSGAIANRTQDSSLMSVNGPEPADNLSFTGMEPRASYSHVQRIPVCIDENDNVALSDSVQEMMAAMTGLPHQDRSLNTNHELSGRDHTLSGIKNSVVYNSQAHNARFSDSLHTAGDAITAQKISQTSNDASLNLALAPISLSFRNQADGSQPSGQGHEAMEDHNELLAPSIVPETSAFAATDRGAASELTTSSHRKGSAAVLTRNESSAESRILTVKSEDKEPYTPKYSLSSVRGHPISNVCVPGGDRAPGSMRSMRPSITNTYDYHDYTTTEDFRSDPVLSDLTATRSTLVQFGNYTTTSQNNSECGAHDDYRDLAYMHKTDPIVVVDDGVELGLSEIRVQPESVHFVENQYNSSGSLSTVLEQHAQRNSSSLAENLTANVTPSLDAQTQKQEKHVGVAIAADTRDAGKLANDALQSASPRGIPQKEPLVQPSLYRLDALDQPSSELMRQFQQFQLFQQFQQLQRMQGLQDFSEAYQHVPQSAIPSVQPSAAGAQALGMYAMAPKAANLDTPCTPISNPKTGPGRPSSARSPYPGIDSRIGGASPFDKTARSASQALLKANLNITESAIDIVNDVVNALDGQGSLEDVPGTQLNLPVTNLAVEPTDKEAVGPGPRSDMEPSESFMTERLRNLSKLPGYKVAGKDEFVLQQAVPKNIADTSIYRYMTSTQKSHFTELKEEGPKMLQPNSSDITIRTYEDSCVFVEDIKHSLYELNKLSHEDVMRLLKQVMLGAVQQHKLLTSYKATTTKLQDEQRAFQRCGNADAQECRSLTEGPDSSSQVQTLKANLRKALARNATLVEKLEEYAERIKEYKRQEKQLAKAERERTQAQYDPSKEQFYYVKASPRRS